jgi:hypothetical protein
MCSREEKQRRQLHSQGSFGSHHLGPESKNSFVIRIINLFGYHLIGYVIHLQIPWFFPCLTLIPFVAMSFSVDFT